MSGHKKPILDFKCYACAEPQSVEAKKPALFQASVVTYRCRNCDGTFILKLKKIPGAKPEDTEVLLQSFTINPKLVDMAIEGKIVSKEVMEAIVSFARQSSQEARNGIHEQLV